MTGRAAPRVPVPPWGLAVGAMLSVQLGSALSVNLMSAIGPAGTAWLRLSMGALLLLALARPPLSAVRPHDVPALLGLGISTGVTTIAFLAAIERIPLGTAVAIEFLGPLMVAALRGSQRAIAPLARPGAPWGHRAHRAVAWPDQSWRSRIRWRRGRRLGYLYPAHPADRRSLHRHWSPLHPRNHRRCHGSSCRLPPSRGSPHRRHCRFRGRARRPPPRPAVRARIACAAPDDAHRLRHPDGARTRDRGPVGARCVTPTSLDDPGCRHRSRRARRCRRAARWPASGRKSQSRRYHCSFWRSQHRGSSPARADGRAVLTTGSGPPSLPRSTDTR
ncbi:MAG: hypothetical protein KatS3mg059_1254 [Thermomicrobiales bacterium]|nr:MAG: hypothetical protein KatS3mg059_1254 [Thermomicrobiales bacterium]